MMQRYPYGMATAALISVNQYLHSSFRPDCDFVDGMVLERSVGNYQHSTLQMLVLMALQAQAAKSGYLVRPEIRIRVRPGKYRVADVIVLPAAESHPPVIETPPLVCIEIVSPDDSLQDLITRAIDYLRLGVPETWILDPDSRKAYVYSTNGLHEDRSGMLSCGAVELDLTALFSGLT